MSLSPGHLASSGESGFELLVDLMPSLLCCFLMVEQTLSIQRISVFL